MTNGYGAMPEYAAQLTPADRWSVAAYIRALQIGQNARESEVPQGSGPESERHCRTGRIARLVCPAVVAARDCSRCRTARPSQGMPGMAPATGESPVPGMSQPGGGAATSGNAVKPKGLK